MGNSGSYGVHIDVQRLALANSDDSKALANKNAKVLDSYSFGVQQSGKVQGLT